MQEANARQTVTLSIYKVNPIFMQSACVAYGWIIWFLTDLMWCKSCCRYVGFLQNHQPFLCMWGFYVNKTDARKEPILLVIISIIVRNVFFLENLILGFRFWKWPRRIVVTMGAQFQTNVIRENVILIVFFQYSWLGRKSLTMQLSDISLS